MPKNITYGPKPDQQTPETPSDAASKGIPHTNNDTPAFETASGEEITYIGGGNDLCARGLFDGTITGAVREPHPTEIWDNVIVTINATTPVGPYDLRMRVPMKTGFLLQKLRLHSGETIETPGRNCRRERKGGHIRSEETRRSERYSQRDRRGMAR
jgi:hypothetical protein